MATSCHDEDRCICLCLCRCRWHEEEVEDAALLMGDATSADWCWCWWNGAIAQWSELMRRWRRRRMMKERNSLSLSFFFCSVLWQEDEADRQKQMNWVSTVFHSLNMVATCFLFWMSTSTRQSRYTVRALCDTIRRNVHRSRVWSLVGRLSKGKPVFGCPLCAKRIRIRRPTCNSVSFKVVSVSFVPVGNKLSR